MWNTGWVHWHADVNIIYLWETNLQRKKLKFTWESKVNTFIYVYICMQRIFKFYKKYCMYVYMYVSNALMIIQTWWLQLH